MCSAAVSSSTATLDSPKLVKFVELLVHAYLQVKGFTATGEKFAEECSKCARDRDTDSSRKRRDVGSVGSAGSTTSNNGSAVDEASSWYYLADKLALPVRWLPTCRAISVNEHVQLMCTSSFKSCRRLVSEGESSDGCISHNLLKSMSQVKPDSLHLIRHEVFSEYTRAHG